MSETPIRVCPINARCNGCLRSIYGSVPDRTCEQHAGCALKAFNAALAEERERQVADLRAAFQEGRGRARAALLARAAALPTPAEGDPTETMEG